MNCGGWEKTVDNKAACLSLWCTCFQGVIPIKKVIDGLML